MNTIDKLDSIHFQCILAKAMTIFSSTIFSILNKADFAIYPVDKIYKQMKNNSEEKQNGMIFVGLKLPSCHSKINNLKKK